MSTGSSAVIASVSAPTEREALVEAARALASRPHRLDDICLAGLVAVDRLLTDLGWKDELGRHVLTLGTALGCLESDYAYYSQILAQGPDRTNPRIFAYTLPNVVLGEVAIAFGSTGDQLAVSAGRASGLAAVIEAHDRIASGEVDRAVALVIDPVGPGTKRLFAAAGTEPLPCALAIALTRADDAPGMPRIVATDQSFDPDASRALPAVDHLSATGLSRLLGARAGDRIEVTVRCPSGYAASLTVT